MKRLLFAASTLALAFFVTLGVRASAASPSAPLAHAGNALTTATDDPVPVECPFCGGDATLHVRRMNNIAVISSRLAYRVLDGSLF